VKLWCQWAWLGGPQAEPGVVLDIEVDRLVSVAGGAEASPPEAERVPGLTIPGLANAHSHAFHRALRSRTQAGRGSFWTWRDQMYRLAAVLTPDAYRRLATATFAEMARRHPNFKSLVVKGQGHAPLLLDDLTIVRIAHGEVAR
jgi:cytosine/adenosine deaminase-related metal-dependent hydrolase